MTINEILIKFLKEEAKLLEKWANESERGGWSTHQVQPMRDRANHIYCILGRFN